MANATTEDEGLNMNLGRSIVERALALNITIEVEMGRIEGGEKGCFPSPSFRLYAVGYWYPTGGGGKGEGICSGILSAIGKLTASTPLVLHGTHPVPTNYAPEDDCLRNAEDYFEPHCRRRVCSYPAEATTNAPSTPGYDTTATSFDVISYPGGEKLTLHGTFQEVYAQVLQLNPNYESDWDDDSRNRTMPMSMPPANVNGNANVERRNRDDYPLLDCVDANGFANEGHIRFGISYIRKEWTLPPGLAAKTCHVVSCAHNSAIRWCNDRDTLRVLPSWDHVADGAQVIADNCLMFPDVGQKTNDVKGKLGHWDEWRVFVDKGKC
ncbi:hypothetical protein BDW74DRAFT_182728 [Aspergillus multicolor]|uniref:uncharacterized protein n=1 Tax=Aspergillus multicolor TaxID=41759 RepID=UPI003CCC8FE0